MCGKSWHVLGPLALVVAIQALPAHAEDPGVRARLRTDRDWNVYWGEDALRLSLDVIHKGPRRLDGLRWEVRLTDLYTNQPAGSQGGRVNVGAGQTAHVPVVFESPRRGLLGVDAQLALPDGTSVARHRIRIGNYLPSVAESMRSALDVDWATASPFGGVLGQCDRRLADMHGVRWGRIERRWRDVEIEPGRYDWTGWTEAFHALRRNHIRPVARTASRASPKSCDSPMTAGHAAAYGAYLHGLAREFHRVCRDWELVCEGSHSGRANDPEMIRHAAAAIRRVDPLARIIVNATGSVDGEFRRRIYSDDTFYDFDVACVHPSCKNQSPERARWPQRCDALRDAIETCGGWQDIWTAEWDWPADRKGPKSTWWVDQRRRARYIVRHHMLTAAARVEKHGLSGYDDPFGIYDDDKPSLAAPANHTMIALLEGHRYVGPLRPLGRDGAYLLVFERNGLGTLVAWQADSRPSTRRTGNRARAASASRMTLDLSTLRVRRYDLMGNTEMMLNATGQYDVSLSASPTYWVGLGAQAVAHAAREQLIEMAHRLTPLAQKADAGDLQGWSADLEKTTTPTRLADRLTRLPRVLTSVASRTDSDAMAATCQALRVAEQLAVLAEASNPAAQRLVEPEVFSPAAQRALTTARRRIELLADGFEQMHRRDHTIGMLRWIIRHARRVLDEAETARRYASYPRVELLTRVVECYVAAGATVFRKHRPVTRCVWITPFTTPPDRSGRTSHSFSLTPNRPGTIHLHISSYALREHRGALVVRLPAGWSTSNATQGDWKVRTVQGRPALAVRDVTVKPMTHDIHPLTLSPPASAKAGRVTLTCRLDVSTLTVPTIELHANVRAPAKTRPATTGPASP